MGISAGVLVAEVDWDEGQAGEGMSFTRVPDAIGEFQTVVNPTPGPQTRLATDHEKRRAVHSREKSL